MRKIFNILTAMSILFVPLSLTSSNAQSSGELEISAEYTQLDLGETVEAPVRAECTNNTGSGGYTSSIIFEFAGDNSNGELFTINNGVTTNESGDEIEVIYYETPDGYVMLNDTTPDDSVADLHSAIPGQTVLFNFTISANNPNQENNILEMDIKCGFGYASTPSEAWRFSETYNITIEGVEGEVQDGNNDDNTNEPEPTDPTDPVDPTPVPDPIPENPVITTSAVYRFFNEGSLSHFYTISEEEKDGLIANNPAWDYEGPVFEAVQHSDGECSEDLVTIYRMYSSQAQKHFFTKDVSEYNYVLDTNPAWTGEDLVYCAFAEDTLTTVPLYQFYSESLQGHFFTANEVEKEMTLENPVWNNFEGEAFYVVPYAESEAEALSSLLSKATEDSLNQAEEIVEEDNSELIEEYTLEVAMEELDNVIEELEKLKLEIYEDPLINTDDELVVASVALFEAWISAVDNEARVFLELSFTPVSEVDNTLVDELTQAYIEFNKAFYDPLLEWILEYEQYAQENDLEFNMNTEELNFEALYSEEAINDMERIFASLYLMQAANTYLLEENNTLDDFGVLEVCTGAAYTGNSIGTSTEEGFVDLSELLVPEYIAEILEDPVDGTQEDTSYKMCYNEDLDMVEVRTRIESLGISSYKQNIANLVF